MYNEPNLQATASVKPTTAASAIESFDALLNHFGALVDKIANCADRVTGSRPQPVENAKEAPQPTHLIAQIQQRRATLVLWVDRLEAEAQRLDSGIS